MVELKGGLTGDYEAVNPGEKLIAASNGTEWHPQCLAGYSGAFCQACPVGTYKYGYSYGRCLPCANKPTNAFYITRAVAISYCPY